MTVRIRVVGIAEILSGEYQGISIFDERLTASPM